MKNAHFTGMLSAGFLAISLLGGGVAHADPVGTKTKYMLGSYPTSGSNAGKYAAAWVDVYSNNCSNPSAQLPSCFETKGDVGGRLLNAQVLDILYGKAYAHHHTPGTGADYWDWGYDVRIFGTALVSRYASISTVQAVMNVAQNMPLDTNQTPFTVKGQKSISLDLSVISSWLGILPDATLTVNYSLNGGVTTQLTVYPASGYGPLAMLNVHPWGSMTANGSVGGSNGYYTVGPVRAKIFTDGNVQVIAPNSWVDLNGTFAFASNQVTLTESHYLRLLKGSASYSVDGWLNPLGQLADTVTEIGCLGGLLCDGTSWSWVNVDSGSIWNQTSSYMKYYTDDATNTIFSGTLPAAAQMP
jgi:hypothetical protein